MEDNLTFIFINGKGSSGKDTQANLIIEKLGERAVRRATGEIFRDALEGKEEYAIYHNRLISFQGHVNAQGGYIPDEVITDIVKDVIDKLIIEGKRTIIFTGFPRTEGQLVELDKMMAKFEGVKTHFVYYEISDETSRERARLRREIAIKEGLSPRDDDQSEVVEKRLNSFRTLTFPMLRRLENEGRLVTFNAEGNICSIERETSAKFGLERI